jgi:hypothetical protein
MQILTDLNSHHAAKHLEHLVSVYVGVDVEVWPRGEGRQPDLHQGRAAVGLTAGHPNEGTEISRR